MRFTVVLVLPALAAAATLHADKEPSGIMRRQSEVELLGGGGMVPVKPSSVKKVLFGGKQKTHDNVCESGKVDGDPGANVCKKPATQKLMESDTDCEFYAMKECPDGACKRVPFMLVDNTTGDFEKFPWRCFKAKDGKWGYNPSGKKPDDANMAAECPTCIPVCEQQEFKVAANKAACDTLPDYEAITDETECKTAVGCANFFPHHEFRDPPTEDDFGSIPEGCHAVGATEARFKPDAATSAAAKAAADEAAESKSGPDAATPAATNTAADGGLLEAITATPAPDPTTVAGTAATTVADSGHVCAEGEKCAICKLKVA